MSCVGRLTPSVFVVLALRAREVAVDGIRDRIAACKKNSLRMRGGPPPGYDPHPDKTRRELASNPVETAVRAKILLLQETHHCLNAAVRETGQLGLRSKRPVWQLAASPGGHPFRCRQIYDMLTKPIYLGFIRHTDQTFDGPHPTIIKQELWDQRIRRASKSDPCS